MEYAPPRLKKTIENALITAAILIDQVGNRERPLMNGMHIRRNIAGQHPTIAAVGKERNDMSPITIDWPGLGMRRICRQ